MADYDATPIVTDKPKKRKKNGSKKDIAKKQRLSSHVTGPDCKCIRLKCFQTVKEENRALLLESFNALPTKDAQDSYLASLIAVVEISRKRPRKEEPKSANSHSYHYKVFLKSTDDVDPDSFAYVCFQAFISIFGIKKGRLETIKRSLATTGLPPVDGRGKHGSHHKISDELRQRIRDHISSFRGRQSHYSQEKTRRLYLPEELSISKMFDLYQEKWPGDSLVYESYRLIFNNDFNIGFGYPRTDTCSACDQFLAKIEIATKTLESDPTNEVLIRDLKQLKFQKDLHQRKADTFYRRKRDAKRRAKITPHLEAFTFDYQKNVNLPNKSTNDFYYNRKLTYQSFNIHQLSTDDVFLYCYDETVARKGSDEVASFLYDHITTKVSEEVTHLELFCDSCSGQNKNFTLIRFLDYMVHHRKRFTSVTVTFPEHGHSYMECDRDMGPVNTKSSASVPEDWIKIFSEARKHPTPFNVTDVKQDLVKNFSGFLRPLYKKGCPFPTRPIREMVFNKDEGPGTVCHRDSWSGIFLKTNITVPTRKNNFSVCTAVPVALYEDRLAISAAKYKDLQVLKKFTTNEAFYDALPYDDKVEDEGQDQ